MSLFLLGTRRPSDSAGKSSIKVKNSLIFLPLAGPDLEADQELLLADLEADQELLLSDLEADQELLLADLEADQELLLADLEADQLLSDL